MQFKNIILSLVASVALVQAVAIPEGEFSTEGNVVACAKVARAEVGDIEKACEKCIYEVGDCGLPYSETANPPNKECYETLMATCRAELGKFVPGDK